MSPYLLLLPPSRMFSFFFTVDTSLPPCISFCLDVCMFGYVVVVPHSLHAPQNFVLKKKASADLIVTKGKSFRHEKNKKKRGSYRGGSIDIHAVNAVAKT